MLTTFMILTVMITALTILPISRHEAWWIRGLDFPRLQLLQIILVVFFMELLLLDLSLIQTWGLIAIALLCLIYQAWWILPYTRLFPVEVKTANIINHTQQIKIMTANVLMPNRNAEGLVALVREYQPDILVTLESDLWWQMQLDTLEIDYPYTIKCPLDNLYGMHVYSKLPLMNCHIVSTINFRVTNNSENNSPEKMHKKQKNT